MKDWIRAFFIGGLIMAGQKIAAQMIGPEYAAMGIPAEFIAAFFLTTRKDKIEYFWGMMLILSAFIFTLSITVWLLYKNEYSGNMITTISLILDMFLAFCAIKLYSSYQ
jgi:hypothetical protein